METKSRERFEIACPNGHREGLLLRCVVDYVIVGVTKDGVIDFDKAKPMIQEPGETIGVDSGVWCPACDEWFEADDCLRVR